MPIIEARKNRTAEWIIHRTLVEGGLRRMFGTIWLHAERATLAALRGTPPAARPPVIWVSPHPSWWDGYLGWLINQRLGNRDGYLMMDAEFLPRYRFFTLAGVFGVDRGNPRAALESVEYIAGLLSARPNRAMWMFPQGTMTPPDRRPLVLYGGVSHIVRRLPAAEVVPVAWRLAFREEQRPEVLIRIAPPLRFTTATAPPSRTLTAQIAAALTAEDDAIRAALIANDLTGYRPLLQGNPGINRRWDDLRAAVRNVFQRSRFGR
jgi:1-acyl-sn-glycerol-3-phosphate acyltransferase